MAKYYGMIGISNDTKETSPGVWNDDVVERPYYGDVIRNRTKWDKSDSVNDNLNISNSISIVADDYILSHLYGIKYATWFNCKWKVIDIEVQLPRIILSVGGVYNGPED